ncbi:MAG TPA: efflux transporter outer membrane subunit [Steroidobacteraceae bacterium]|nr:efflux transporter outer membrane subunit [Steroidobacteraceae bacterium]
MTSRLMQWMTWSIAGLRELGPYAAVELVLPGGSIIAVLMWLYRRHRKQHPRANRALVRRAGAVAAAAVSTVLLAACASTHGLAPQASEQKADTLATSRTLSNTAVDASAWPQKDWWTEFGDPQLNQLISEGLADSPSLRVAEARTRAALGQAGIANSARYPQINADADATRERFAEHSLYPPPFAGNWDTLSELKASLTWEIDFWGKNRSAYEQALGTARAAQLDAQAARLVLATNIAHAYVQLERAYLQLDVAQATLQQREQIYKLTQDRSEAGIDSKLELRQAQSALPAAREQIAQLQESIELTRNQLAALLGQGPDRGMAITRPAANALTPVSLPSRIPSELLGRRPDIRADRLRIEAARHGIDNAKAQFYPDVNLAAFVGFQNLGPTALLTAANREIGAGPAVSLPIFDAGRRRGNLQVRDSEYDIAVEQYNQALADGLRDVVDQLASFRSVDEQRRQQREGLSTAQDAYDLATLRYREGVGNYLQVLTTESQLLTQRSLDADLRARSLDLSVNLARALGGGFQQLEQ